MKNKTSTACIVIGVLGSMISASIATKRIIEKDDKSKTDAERVKDAIPSLITPALIGGITIFHILRNEKINKTQQESLLLAYSILSNKLSSLKQTAIREDDGTCITLSGVLDDISIQKAEKKGYKKIKGKDYLIDEYFEYPFYATPIILEHAMKKLNRKFHKTGEVTMSDLYRFVGCPATGHVLENFGWNKDFLDSEFGFDGDICFSVLSSPHSEIKVLKMYPEPMYAYQN